MKAYVSRVSDMPDEEVFRRSERASWSVRRREVVEAYATHIRCPHRHKKATSYEKDWSWFLEDEDSLVHNKPACYWCGCKVPDYIQAMVRLYNGR